MQWQTEWENSPQRPQSFPANISLGTAIVACQLPSYHTSRPKEVAIRIPSGICDTVTLVPFDEVMKYGANASTSLTCKHGHFSNVKITDRDTRHANAIENEIRSL